MEEMLDEEQSLDEQQQEENNIDFEEIDFALSQLEMPNSSLQEISQSLNDEDLAGALGDSESLLINS